MSMTAKDHMDLIWWILAGRALRVERTGGGRVKFAYANPTGDVQLPYLFIHGLVQIQLDTQI